VAADWRPLARWLLNQISYSVNLGSAGAHAARFLPEFNPHNICPVTQTSLSPPAAGTGSLLSGIAAPLLPWLPPLAGCKPPSRAPPRTPDQRSWAAPCTRSAAPALQLVFQPGSSSAQR
jgi:hypothetical protein